MLRHLDSFIQLLSETNQVWEEFKGCDLGYFVPAQEPMAPFTMIQKSYSSLRLTLATLKSLREQIRGNQNQVCLHRCNAALWYPSGSANPESTF